MPLGMTTQVIQPTAAASPDWVQHSSTPVATIWSYHPIAAPASAVWIQVGIGVWLLAAATRELVTAGGLGQCGWGLVVWIFGEAFGGIFAPGLTWLVRRPRGGALLLPRRCPDRPPGAMPGRRRASVGSSSPSWGSSSSAWRCSRRGPGGLLAGPDRAQRHSGDAHRDGPRDGPNPPARSSRPGCRSFAAFDAATAGRSTSSWSSPWRPSGCRSCPAGPGRSGGVIAGVVLCLADWVLIEDLGFLGGVGTDPNSMIPMALVFVAGYLAMTEAASPPTFRSPRSEAAYRRASLRGATVSADPGYALRSSLRSVPSASSSSAPFRWRRRPPTPTPIPSSPRPSTARRISPTRRHRLSTWSTSTVSPCRFAGLRGKTVALTFLDPVCARRTVRSSPRSSAGRQPCSERDASVEIGRDRRQSPVHGSAVPRAFDQQESSIDQQLAVPDRASPQLRRCGTPSGSWSPTRQAGP